MSYSQANAAIGMYARILRNTDREDDLPGEGAAAPCYGMGI